MQAGLQCEGCNSINCSSEVSAHPKWAIYSISSIAVSPSPYSLQSLLCSVEGEASPVHSLGAVMLSCSVPLVHGRAK